MAAGYRALRLRDKGMAKSRSIDVLMCRVVGWGSARGSEFATKESRAKAQQKAKRVRFGARTGHRLYGCESRYSLSTLLTARRSRPLNRSPLPRSQKWWTFYCKPAKRHTTLRIKAMCCTGRIVHSSSKMKWIMSLDPHGVCPSLPPVFRSISLSSAPNL
jgi:hypothetical protein